VEPYLRWGWALLIRNNPNHQRICIVVSDFMTVCAFLQDQIRALSKTYEVTVVANIDDRD
jgi:hypothetical protein